VPDQVNIRFVARLVMDQVEVSAVTARLLRSNHRLGRNIEFRFRKNPQEGRARRVVETERHIKVVGHPRSVP